MKAGNRHRPRGKAPADGREPERRTDRPGGEVAALVEKREHATFRDLHGSELSVPARLPGAFLVGDRGVLSGASRLR